MIIPVIFLWSGGSAVLALIGLLIAHKLVEPIDFEKHQPVLDASLNIIGTLVSILLGLLVAASLANYQALESDADAEAANVAEICRLSLGLPAERRKRLVADCVGYSELVIDDDWPSMAKGKGSDKVLDKYLDIMEQIVTFNPSTNGESNIQQSLITAMQQVGDYRRHRILWLNNNWNRNLLPILLMCSLIVLTFAYLYVKRGAFFLHGFLICFVAAALGANIGMVCLLSRPFSGEWKIQPKGFMLNLEMIHRYFVKGKYAPLSENMNDSLTSPRVVPDHSAAK